MQGSESLRILVLHNFYRQRGGEERSVSEQVKLLQERGHHVTLLDRHSEKISRKEAGTYLLHGGYRPEEVADAVRQESIDVVHVHNMLPSFGVKSLTAARKAGAAIVLNLHNYRIFCGIGTSYRSEAPCTRCKGRNTVAGTLLRCRGSLLESAAYSLSLSRYQSQLFKTVDSFALPSRGMLGQLRAQGFSTDKVSYVRNFLPTNQFAQSSSAGSGKYAVYIGRITEEKGVDTAVKACVEASVPLKVVGSGPDESRVKELAGTADIEFTGQLPPSEVDSIRADAAFALMPSKWSEPAPYSVIESMSQGLPVLVSPLGGLTELTGDLSTVVNSNLEGWTQAVKELWEGSQRRQSLGHDSLLHAQKNFTEELAYNDLTAAYSAAKNQWETV